MDRLCEHCCNTFSGMPHLISKRRFCGRKCWFAWRIGPNNAQTKRITIACNACSKVFEKTPSKLGQLNYCSRACAQTQHGHKVSAEKHGRWRGGRFDARGSRWRAARQTVLERQGFKCFSCGMSNEIHERQYKNGLHVHHRMPFRLAFDNSSDNLVAVCVKCHGVEERLTRRSLMPADIATMKLNTEYARALGLDKDDFTRMYDTCPQCCNRKAKRATLCRTCRTQIRITNILPKFFCPKCGHSKVPRAVMCWSCHIKP